MKTPISHRVWTGLAAVLLGATIAMAQKPKASQPAEATGFDYTHSRSFPDVWSAYSSPFVPEAKLKNSELLSQLTSDGTLNLSLEDAIALSLENNLDIAVARYNLPIAQTDLLRAKAGGATRGVAGAFQSSAIFGGAIGSGVSSSTSNGGSGAGGILGGGVPTVSAAGCCDPNFYIAYGWGSTVTPLNFTIVSGVPIEAAHSAYVATGYSQGFLTGTSLSVMMFGSRESTNATTNLFNPDLASNLTIGITQHFLNGFGRRANARFIRIARNEQKYSASVFRQKVVDTVTKVMSTYYDLLADREDIRVAQEGLGYAQKLLADNKEEQKIGAVAQLDVAQAELAVAKRQQDLLTAENAFSQDAQSMKSLISKSFNGEIATVRINPTDQLPKPHEDDIPPFPEALREAEVNRPEIVQAKVNLKDQRITIQATRNALLPSLDGFAAYSPTGLAGDLGGALSPLFRNRFPAYSYGVSLSIPIRNRVAQADAARALLEQRQLQMSLQQAENQSVWDVSKAESAVEQARGQLAAAKNVAALARDTLSMEHTKFTVGQATVQEVIDAQGALATAEGGEVKEEAAYAKALVQFEQATGTVLKRNNIGLADAERGQVARNPNIPGTPVGQP